MRTYRLDAVRADAWFEKLVHGDASMRELAKHMGETTLAMLLISGIRLRSLTVNPDDPGNSIVEFELPQNANTARMPLLAFQSRLAQAILTEPDPNLELPENPNANDLADFLGTRMLVLSAALGLSLLELREDDHGVLEVVVETGDTRDTLPLEELRHLIREQIVSEIESSQSVFSIDGSLVEQARTHAANGDVDSVKSLLSGWMGPLSSLIRSEHAAQLPDNSRAVVVDGMLLLGAAFERNAANDHSDRANAETCFRLAAQWAGKSALAARAASAFGSFLLNRNRPAESLNHLRRAVDLDASSIFAWTTLGKAFLALDRRAATIACVAAAKRLEEQNRAQDDEPDDDLHELVQSLTQKQIDWKSMVAESESAV